MILGTVGVILTVAEEVGYAEGMLKIVGALDWLKVDDGLNGRSVVLDGASVSANGRSVGILDGASVGIKDGASVGIYDGASVGILDGASVSITDGCSVGILDGASVGISDGASVGITGGSV